MELGVKIFLGDRGEWGGEYVVWDLEEIGVDKRIFCAPRAIRELPVFII